MITDVEEKKMHIVVCIKYMLNTKQNHNPFSINKYDKAALETGIYLKNKLEAMLTVVTMGPERAEDILRYAVAAGADKGILITDKALAASDTYITAKVLAEAIRKVGSADIVICGSRSSDGDTGQVGPQTAVDLDIPHLSNVTEISDIQPDDIEVTVRSEREYLTYRAKYPIMLCVSECVHNDLYDLKRFQKAMRAEIERYSVRDLGLSAENVGQFGSKTEVIRSQAIVYDNNCHFINMDDMTELFKTLNKYKK